jgi:peptidoglycan-N-acetylglucosamine deacetylase
MKRPMYITTSWDDGHPLDLRIAELLHKHALPGTFYIPIKHKFPLLTHAQIRDLGGSFEIGGHTVSHCDLLSVSDEAARGEIRDCKQQLEQISARQCSAFCFPKGHFLHKHVHMVREAGFRTARTVELMSVAAPRLEHGVAIVPTTMQATASRRMTFVRNSLKRLKMTNLLRYIRHSKSDWVETTAAVLHHISERGGVFHLWGHSWEIAERGEWENVERVFGLLRQCKGKAIFVHNSDLAELAG